MSTASSWIGAIVLTLFGLTVRAAEYPLLGMEAPNFTLRAAAGSNVRLSEHRGDVVVVTFWGSRCNTCRAQLAALERSHATYRSAGLQVFGVGIDDDPARAREFALAQKVSFPMLLDPGKAVGRRYFVDSLPLTLLIDRGGAIRHVYRDYSEATEAACLRQLRVLLNE